MLLFSSLVASIWRVVCAAKVTGRGQDVRYSVQRARKLEHRTVVGLRTLRGVALARLLRVGVIRIIVSPIMVAWRLDTLRYSATLDASILDWYHRYT